VTGIRALSIIARPAIIKILPLKVARSINIEIQQRRKKASLGPAIRVTGIRALSTITRPAIIKILPLKVAGNISIGRL
jgi:fatty acid/phospholipid biosynthesis enzyme